MSPVMFAEALVSVGFLRCLPSEVAFPETSLSRYAFIIHVCARVILNRDSTDHRAKGLIVLSQWKPLSLGLDKSK